MGGQEEYDIIKAFTNALFETYRNLANYGIVVSNLATVDAPGCDYITAKRFVSSRFYTTYELAEITHSQA